MEQWLVDAKDRAKREAEEIVENLREIAFTESLDDEWFVEEVVKNIHRLKTQHDNQIE